MMKRRMSDRLLAMILCLCLMMNMIGADMAVAFGETVPDIVTASDEPQSEPEATDQPEPQTPAEPEVSELPEPQTSTEPEAADQPEPQSSAEPEVSELPEPQTSAEPEVSELPEPQTSAEPEVSELPEPQTSAEPEASELPEPQTSAEPDASELPESQTSAEPDASELPDVSEEITPEQTAAGSDEWATPEPTETPEPEKQDIVGDINGDGAVNLDDLQALLRAGLSLREAQERMPLSILENQLVKEDVFEAELWSDESGESAQKLSSSALKNLAGPWDGLRTGVLCDDELRYDKKDYPALPDYTFACVTYGRDFVTELVMLAITDADGSIQNAIYLSTVDEHKVEGFALLPENGKLVLRYILEEKKDDSEQPEVSSDEQDGSPVNPLPVGWPVVVPVRPEQSATTPTDLSQSDDDSGSAEDDLDAWIEQRLRAIENQYNSGIAPMAFVEGYIPWDAYFTVAGLPATVTDEQWFTDCKNVSAGGYNVDNTGVKYTKFPQYDGVHFTSVTVNGVEVVRAGILAPDTGTGEPLYYYLTQKHVDSDASDGSGSHTGSISALLLPRGTKFQVNYAVNEYKLSYQILLDGADVTNETFPGADQTWERTIFAGQNPASTNNGAASLPVTIPYGYTARVYWVLDGSDEEIELTGPQKDDSTVNEGYPLGTEPKYEVINKSVRLASGYPSAKRMSAVFYADLITENRAVVVKLTADTEEPVFDAHWWLKTENASGRGTTGDGLDRTQKDGNINTEDGWGWNNDKSAFNQDPRNNTNKSLYDTHWKKQSDGTWSLDWIFQTNAGNFVLNSLELNGEYIDIPFTPIYKGYMNSNEEAPGTRETTTVLSNGAVVTLTFYREFGSTQRVYILKITGARSSVTVTGGNLMMFGSGAPEYVATVMAGVTTDENNSDTFCYFSYATKDWLPMEKADIQVQEGGPVTDFNGDPAHKYANLRFKLQTGYEDPYYLWENRMTTQTLESSKGKAAIAWDTAPATLASGNIYGPDNEGWYYIRIEPRNRPGGENGHKMCVLTLVASARKFMLRYMVGSSKNDETNVPDDTVVDNMPTFDIANDEWDEGLEDELLGKHPERYDDNNGSFYDRQSTPAVAVSDLTPTTSDNSKFFQYWVLVDEYEELILRNGKPIIVRPNEIIDLNALARYGISLNKDVGGDATNYYILRLKGVWTDLPSDFEFYIRMVWTEKETGQTHIMDLVQNVVTSSTDKNLTDDDCLIVTVNTVTDTFKNWFALHPFYAYGTRSFMPTSSHPDDTMTDADGNVWEKYPAQFTEGSAEKGVPNPDAYYRVETWDDGVVRYIVQRGGTIIIYLDPVNGRLPITKTVVGAHAGADEFTYTVTAKLLPEDIARSQLEAGKDPNYLSPESLRNMLPNGTFFGMAPDATETALRDFTGRDVNLHFARNADGDDMTKWYSTATFTLKSGEATILGVPQGLYTITEENQADANTHPFLYRVTVNGAAAEDRTATTEVRIGSTMDPVHFCNEVLPGSCTLDITTTITTANSGTVVPDALFSYKLELVSGSAGQIDMPSDDVSIRTQDGHGASHFNTVTFSHAGTYEFLATETLKEIFGGDQYANTITHAISTRSVTVVVTNVNGELKITKIAVDGTIYLDTETDHAVVPFQSTYSPIDPGKVRVIPQVRKILYGRSLLPSMFEFQLTDPTGKTYTTTNNAAANGSAGVVSFPPIDITEDDLSPDGTYTVTVREIVGEGQTGIDYDDRVITITYKAEIIDGQLQLTDTTYKDGQGSAFDTFINYAYVDTGFDVVKHYDVSKRPGVAWEEDTFTVVATLTGVPEVPQEQKAAALVRYGETELRVNDSVELTLTQAKQTGRFDFRFLNQGVYTFRVTEKNEKLPGVSYDSSVYYVTVTVTTNGDVLLSSVSVAKSGKPAADNKVTFENKFDPEHVDVTINAKKWLKYKDGTPAELDAGRFHFMLTPTEGTTGVALTAANEADGTVTFTLKNLGVGIYTYKLTELNEGEVGVKEYDDTVYFVRVVVTREGEMAASYTVTNSENEEDVVSEFTNILETYGSLTVSNTVEGPGSDQNKLFTYTFTFTDENGDPLTGSFRCELKVGGIATALPAISNNGAIQLKHGQSVTVYGLPTGTKYTVTESDYDVYTVSHDGEESDEATGDIRGGETAAFLNKLETGNLTLSKQVTGVNSNEGQDFTFTITLKDAGGNPLNGTYEVETVGDVSGLASATSITFENGEATVHMKHGGKLTIKGLINATVYTIREEPVEDYTAIVNGRIADIATGRIVGGQTQTAAYVNANPLPALLDIEKTQAVNSGEGTKEPVAVVGGDTITYTIDVCNKGQFAASDIVITDQIPEGLLYAEITCSSGDASIDDSGLLTWRIDELAQWQTSDDPSTPLDRASLTVTVTVPWTATAKTWTNTATAKYVRQTDDETEEVEISSDPVVASAKPGSLTIEKKVTGLAAGEIDDTDFTFTVTLALPTGAAGAPEGQYPYTGKGSVEFANGEATVTLKKDQSVTISGLPAGTGYVVAETPNDHYTTTTRGNLSDQIAAGGTATVTFVNYKHQANTKALTGNVKAPVKVGQEFTYEIRWANNTAEAATVTITDELEDGLTFVRATPAGKFAQAGQTVVWTLESCPAMSTGRVTVTVRVNEAALQKAREAWQIVNQATVQVQGGQGAPTNQVTTALADTGSLTLTKTVTGEGAETDRAFTFTVSAVDAWNRPLTGQYTYADPENSGVTRTLDLTSGSATVSLKHGQSITINGLPDGAAYTVTETPTEGYNSNRATLSGKISATTPATTAFINTRIPAALSLEKTQRGGNAATATKEAITVTPGDEIVYEITVTNTSNVAASAVEVSDTLPAGLTVLSTDPAAVVSGSTVTWNVGSLAPSGQSGSAKTLKITAAVPFVTTGTTWTNRAYATFSNHPANLDSASYPVPSNAVAATFNPGRLTLSKSVTGLADGQTDETGFVFTVTLTLPQGKAAPESGYPYTLNGTTAYLKSGSNSITLKNGQSITVNGLPAGSTYTVTEATPDKATVHGRQYAYGVSYQIGNGSAVKSSATGNQTISAGTESRVTFFNEYPNPMFDVVKSVGLTCPAGDATHGAHDEDADGNLIAHIGDTVTYTITVTNTGNVDLTNLSLTDDAFTVNGLTSALSGLGLDAQASSGVGASDNVGSFSIKAGAGMKAVFTATYGPIGVRDAVLVNAAKVENGTQVKQSNTVTTTVVRTPAMSTAKTINTDLSDPAVNGKYKVGDKVYFDILITNEGNTTLENVTVSEQLTDAAFETYADCGYEIQQNQVTISAIIDSVTVRAWYTVKQADVDNGGLTNTAVVTAPELPAQYPSAVVQTVDRAPNIAIAKAVTKIATTQTDESGQTSSRELTDAAELERYLVQEGDVITFTITVTNSGNVTLKNIDVTDPWAITQSNPTGRIGTIASLAPLGSAEITFAYTVTQTDIDNSEDKDGVLTNTATATAAEPKKPDGSDVTASASKQIVTNQRRGMSARKTIPAAYTDATNAQLKADYVGAQVNDEVVFEIHVKNTGTVTLKNVTVTENAADLTNLTFKAFVTSASGAYAVSNNTATIGSIAPGETVIVTATCTVDSIAANPENIATVTDTNPKGGAPLKPSVIVPRKAWSVEKSVSGMSGAFIRDEQTGKTEQAARLNDTLTYAITVRNTGETALRNLTVTDTLNGQAIQWTGARITITGNETASEPFAGVIALLSAGQTATITYTHQVTAADAKTGLTNTVSAPDPANGQDASHTFTIHTPAEAWTIEKALTQVTRDGAALVTGATTAEQIKVRAGDTLTYTVTVTNQGSVQLDNLTITDALTRYGLAAGTDRLSGGADSGVSFDPETGKLSGLAPNGTATLTYTCAAADGDVYLSNIATASKPKYDQNGSATGATSVSSGAVDSVVHGDVIVAKEWKDGDGNALTDPKYTLNAQIGISLTQTDSAGQIIPDYLLGTLSGQLDWSATFTDVPLSAKIDGAIVTYAYTATETAAQNGLITVNGFTFSVGTREVGEEPDSQNIHTLVITNTLVNGETPKDAEKTAKDSAGNALVNGSAVQVGDTVTYTIRRESHLARATVAEVTDTLPEGLTFDAIVSVKVDGALWTLTTNPQPEGKVYTQSVVPPTGNTKTTALKWVIYGVPPTATVEVSYTATVNAKAAAKPRLTNTASVAFGSDRKDAAHTVDVLQPNLTLVKTADVVAAAPGEWITYTLTVANQTGSGRADGFTVTDTLPAYVTNVSFEKGVASDDSTVTVTGNELTWTFRGNLNPGQQKTLTITAMVRTGYLTKTDEQGATAYVDQFVNAAAITDGDGDNGPENSDSAQTLVADFTLSKAYAITAANGTAKDAGAVAALNDVMTYTITVKNVGGAALTDLIVRDTMFARAENLKVGGQPSTFDTVTDASGSEETVVRLASLAAGASTEITYTVTVTEADIKAGKLENTATAKGEYVASTENGAQVKKASNEHSQRVAVQTEEENPSWAVTKAVSEMTGATADGMTYARLNDELVYTITVENTGNVTLESLRVEDVLESVTAAGARAGRAPDENSVHGRSHLAPTPDDETEHPHATFDTANGWTISNLAPGEIMTITYTYTVAASDMSTTLRNVATVNTTAHPAENPPSGRTETPVEGWTVKKAVGTCDADGVWHELTGSVDPQTELVYRVTVANNSGHELNGLILTDTFKGIPMDADALSQLSVVSGESSASAAYEVDGTEGVGRIDRLPGAGRIVLEYRYTVADIEAGSQITNTVSVSGAASSVTTSVNQPNPGLTLEKKVSIPGPGQDAVIDVNGKMVPVGTRLTYTVTLTNTGNVTLWNVTLADEFRAPSGGTLSEPEIDGGSFTDDSNTVIGQIAPHQTVTVRYTYDVAADDARAMLVADCKITNQVSATYDFESVARNAAIGSAGPALVTTDVESPRWKVSKTVSGMTGSTVLGKQAARVGDELVYTVTVENTGNVALNDLALTDTLVPDLSGATVSGGRLTEENGSWALSGVAVGRAATITYTYQVTAPTDLGGIENEMTASGVADYDPVLGDNTASTSTSVEAWTVSKSLSKVDGTAIGESPLQPVVIKAGNTVEYTVTVTNIGSADLTGLSLTDALTVTDQNGVTTQPTALEWAQSDFAPGESADSFGVAAGTSRAFHVLYTVGTQDVFLSNVATVSKAKQGAAGTDSVSCAAVENVVYVDVIVTKAWLDADGSPLSSALTDNVMVQLYRDGVSASMSVSLPDTTTQAWTGSWTNLPAYDTARQAPYVYTVRETSAAADAQSGDTITLPKGYSYTVSIGSDADATSSYRYELVNTLRTQTPSEPEKTHQDADGKAEIGDTIPYTITRTSHLNRTSTATITDTLPAGLTFNEEQTETVTVKVNDTVVAQGWSFERMSAERWDDGTTAVVWRIQNVPPMATVSISYTATVNALAIHGPSDTLTNHASVDFGDGDPDGSFEAEQGITILKPELRIEKVSNPKAVTPGERFTYRLTVTNSGSGKAVGVKVMDLLPANMTFAAATASPDGMNAPELAADSGNEILWEIGTLASGGVVTAEITVTVNGGEPEESGNSSYLTDGNAYVTSLRNTARIIAGMPMDSEGNMLDHAGRIVNPADPANDPYTDTADTAIADVYIDKNATDDVGEPEFGQDAKDRYQPGSKITYTIRVKNIGNAALTDVVVTDAMLAAAYEGKLILQRTDGSEEPIERNADNISVTIPGGLQPAEDVTIVYVYEVTQDDINKGSKIENTAYVTAKYRPDPDQQRMEETNLHLDTQCMPANPMPQWEISKVSNVAEGERALLGQTIAYTITVRNTGNVSFPNVLVTDDALMGLKITGFRSNQPLTAEDDITIDNAAQTVLIRRLRFNETVTILAEYVVTEKDILAGSVVNLVTVIGDPVVNQDYDPTQPEDPEHNPAQKAPEGEARCEDLTKLVNSHLTVVKAETSTPKNGRAYLPGEVIAYEIKVVNSGNLTLTDITVTDEKTNDLWTILSLTPGESMSFTAAYTVTEADALAGRVVNVATAKGTAADPDAPEVTGVSQEVVSATELTPTDEPTVTPTDEPTATPTDEPTATPTDEPTATPTAEPTATPTETPTEKAPEDTPVPAASSSIGSVIRNASDCFE